MPVLSAHDIQQLSRIPRLTLINAITGFKSGNLIGTVSADGITNLAIFSSAVHIGSDPALIGLVTRPVVPDGKTSRHSYENIKHSGLYTINHVHTGMIAAAHQTSASYPDGVSEFEAVGLTPEYLGLPGIPYVQESRIKMGMEYVEEYAIRANDTILIIGKVLELVIPDGSIDEQGNLDLLTAETVAVSGLDTYYAPQLLQRRPYARP
jgi:flavin reductase (DIM6/NTAB) family NADH-FMN oxidoreductase RutF